MSLVVGDILELKFEGTCLEQAIQFVHHYRVSATNSDVFVHQMDAIVEAFGTTGATTPDMIGDYVACLPTGYTLENTSVQRVSPTRSARFDWQNSIPGSGGAGPVTANISSTFTLAGLLPKRNNLSKKHVGPLPNSAYADGFIKPAYQTLTLNPLMLDLLTIITQTTSMGNTVTLIPVVYHRQPNANPKYDDLFLKRTNDKVRTMRRRTIGVGI